MKVRTVRTGQSTNQTNKQTKTDTNSTELKEGQIKIKPGGSREERKGSSQDQGPNMGIYGEAAAADARCQLSRTRHSPPTQSFK